MIIVKILVLLVFCYVVCQEFTKELRDENERLREENKRLKDGHS